MRQETKRNPYKQCTLVNSKHNWNTKELINNLTSKKHTSIDAFSDLLIHSFN